MNEDLFPNEYFQERVKNDKLRLSEFMNEAEFMRRHNINFEGKVCDIGCSTGEFLDVINWSGEKYGMEINDYAKSIAIAGGVKFDCNIKNAKDFFDLVIFRGTLQHVDQPFEYLRMSFEALKQGGMLAILATPNVDSVYYRMFKDLPALDTKRSFFIPGKDHVIDLCERYGFKLVSQELPYLRSSYANPRSDFFITMLRIFFKRKKFMRPFPGNMMNLLFRKEV